MKAELRLALEAIQREVLAADLTAVGPDASERAVDDILSAHLTNRIRRASVELVSGVDGSTRRADLALQFLSGLGQPPLVIGLEFKLYRTRHQGAGELDRGLGQCIAYADAYDAVALIAVYMATSETAVPGDWASIDAPLWIERRGRRVPVIVIRRQLVAENGKLAPTGPGPGRDQASGLAPVVRLDRGRAGEAGPRHERLLQGEPRGERRLNAPASAGGRGISRDRLLELVAGRGLTWQDQAQWTKIAGTGSRRLYVKVGDPVAEIHLSGFRITSDILEPISPAEARERHLGRVRGRSFPARNDCAEVEGFVSSALDALLDPTLGVDVP